MDKRLFFLINMAQHRMFKHADAYSEQHLGISVTQAAALMFVAKNEGCLQKALSSALGLNNSAVTGLVGRMQKNNLIQRKPCPEDGRASRLFLTEQGQTKLPEIFPLIQRINETLTADFSDEEIEVVVRFLNKVMQDFS
jgi:DNA-binding MarR family transcriptional regulator